MLVTVCLIISLVSASTHDLPGDEPGQTAVGDTLDVESKFELSSEMSDFISKNAMYPLLVVEVVIFVYLNSRLLWMWYSAGEFNTNVNKLIFILRILGIIHEIGCVVDFGIRLYGPKPVPFMSSENYCACWIAFYKTIFYACMGCHFATAFIRVLCVAYPIEYHQRSDFLI